MQSHQLINQDSGTVEYYTPATITTKARCVMGGIDLDPASSQQANKTIRADIFYTKEDDGLSKVWSGRVWMNHPFNRKLNAIWIKKLVGHYMDGDISQACCICYASTSELWFQPLMQFPQCFLSPRTSYVLPDGTLFRGATKGSVVTYMGSRINEFAESFREMGAIKVSL